jgi:hypothetical protein
VSTIHFDPNCSNGTLNDTISYLYIPAVVTKYIYILNSNAIYLEKIQFVHKGNE